MFLFVLQTLQPALRLRLQLGPEATTALSRRCLGRPWPWPSRRRTQSGARCSAGCCPPLAVTRGSSLLLAPQVSLMPAARGRHMSGNIWSQRMGGSRPHLGLLLCRTLGTTWLTPHRAGPHGCPSLGSPGSRGHCQWRCLWLMVGFAPVTRGQRATQVQLPGEKGLGGRPEASGPFPWALPAAACGPLIRPPAATAFVCGQDRA